MAAARAYCAGVLRDAGFAVSEEPFEYSQLPGRYGTPAAGVWSALAIAATAVSGARGRAALALVIAAAGLALLAIAGLWLARSGVLRARTMRAEGVNLVARRPGPPPLVWLVAHADSKSQPVPMLLRVAGIVALGLAWTATLVLAIVQVAGGAAHGWTIVGVAGVVAALPVAATLVGNHSAGAVDNASGLAAVLVAAAAMPNECRVGVVVTDAEELGLAGARAWCRYRRGGIALNCDGVDDAGTLVAMHTGTPSTRLLDVARRAASAEQEALRVRRLLPGVLVDAVALHDAGFETITFSRGDAGTLRRIHTHADDLAHLRGDGIDGVARVLARVARELC